MTDLVLPLPAQELIPHRPPMRLVERLLEVDGKNGVVEVQIGSESLLIDAEGMLEDLALVEIMAQSYATLKGYIDRRDQLPVRQGFLVGIKKMVRYASVMADDRLQVHIRTIAELEDFAVAEGEIRRGAAVIAAGDVKVWIN
ncbi:MAG TPA: hypothetical protein VKN62_02475 [Pelovirga sp.]|nr:hypothetical protein [Pelovirga sp.]